jgi:hypothetical protein
MISELKLEVFPHPAYSPDLASFNYHIFEPLTDTLDGC